MSDIVVERKGEVEWIRMNRPDRMNAYDAAMAKELISAVQNASDAGVIVLTGTGRAFCAGGYLANLSDPDPRELRSMFYGSLQFYEALRLSPRPVIAAVNGAAAGGGNEIVVACDLAIAAENATFGQPEVALLYPGAYECSLGFWPGIGATCACPGDMNGDVYRDGADIQAFVACWLGFGAGCACADADGDGGLKYDDVSHFVTILLTMPDCP